MYIVHVILFTIKFYYVHVCTCTVHDMHTTVYLYMYIEINNYQ